MKLLPVLLWAAIIGGHASATEVDNFTPQLIKMKDSLPYLNALTKKRLQEAAQWANSKSSTCDGKTLRAGVWQYLGGNLWGRLENEIERDPAFDKVAPTLSQSVYEYLTPLESLFATDVVKLGSVIRLGDYKIGSDKFGHFFAEGNALFKRAFLERQGVDEAMKYSEATERGIFGALTTAVYTYADTVANFNGMIFWSKLTPEFAANTPFIGAPYFECKNNRWVQTREMRWEEIIDAAWDESTNCNAFRTKAIHDKVTFKIHQLENLYERYTGKSINLQCPINPQGCLQAVEKYKRFAPKILHRDCYRAARDLYYNHHNQN